MQAAVSIEQGFPHLQLMLLTEPVFAQAVSALASPNMILNSLTIVCM